MDRKDPRKLQEHMLGTYDGLRIGIAAIGVALPLIVLSAGFALHHVLFEPSISDYYHTPARTRFFTTRDLFVGCLLAVGACLYLYKGFSTRENVALNLAGVFAAVVALFPTATPCPKGTLSCPGDLVSTVHVAAAVLFFLCIAYVSLFRSRDTLSLLPPERQEHYERHYLWTGVAMVLSPIAAVVLALVFKQIDQDPGSGLRTLVFCLETCGVGAFVWYWIKKTREMRESRAEQRALDAELQREVVPIPATADAVRARGASGVILRMLSPNTGQVERIVPADQPNPDPVK